MKHCLALLALILSAPLSAQNIDALRGAWIADHDGQRHVLYLVYRHDTLSGFHCFDCTNPDNLTFVDDAKVSAQSLSFSLYHTPANAPPFVEMVTATQTSDGLQLTVSKARSAPLTLTMHRAPAQVIPPAIANATPNQPPAGQARILPAPAEPVTADKVLGLWLWGTGPTKQYFIFKPHKDGIRGMVCGPCDSAKDFAPLEMISMQDTNFHFEIVHEDNGIGFEEHGPFSNVSDARIVLNEMHLTVYASFDPGGRLFEMTLLGPVQYMPAATP